MGFKLMVMQQDPLSTGEVRGSSEVAGGSTGALGTIVVQRESNFNFISYRASRCHSTVNVQILKSFNIALQSQAWQSNHGRRSKTRVGYVAMF